jgi:hypothetical protein
MPAPGLSIVAVIAIVLVIIVDMWPSSRSGR